MQSANICIAQSLESLDNGKPFLQALSVDLMFVTSFLRYFAGAADKIVGQTIPAGTLFYCCQILYLIFYLLSLLINVNQHWSLFPLKDVICRRCHIFTF